MNIFDHYRQRYEAAKDEEFTLQEFLTVCRQDRSRSEERRVGKECPV